MFFELMSTWMCNFSFVDFVHGVRSLPESTQDEENGELRKNKENVTAMETPRFVYNYMK